MASSNVNPVSNEAAQADPTQYVGKVTRKVEHPLTGKSIKREGNLIVPQVDPAGDVLNQMLDICQKDDQKVAFWFNYALKTAARAQMNQELDFDLGSDELNGLYGQFQNARKNMVESGADETAMKELNQYILSRKKFEPLKAKFDEIEKTGLESLNLNFAIPSKAEPGKDEKVPDGATALKQPSGIRGKQPTKKADGSEAEAEEETEE